MHEESSVNWLRNGVATWSGSVYMYDSKRTKTAPRPAEEELVETVPEPEPAPAPILRTAERTAVPSDRMVVHATPSGRTDWSHGDWQVTSPQDRPRRVTGLDRAGNGWAIEFGTGRMVRLRRGRPVD